MTIVNNIHLIKILNLLEISTKELVNHLYVSQSLVSRWKNGSRKLNTDSENYSNLLNYFLNTNKERRLFELETYISNFFDEPVYKSQEELKEQLNKFMICKEPSYKKLISDNTLISKFYTFTGLDGRLEAMELFFNTAFGLKDTPDMYLFDSQYYNWDTGPNRYHPTFLSNCLKYMRQGGKIYLFSSLINTDKESFYCGWQFTVHKNLYPGYFSNFTNDKVGYSYYIIKDVMSMVFYSPDNNSNNYYTAIFTDKTTCKAHLEYIQRLYSNTEMQLLLNSKTNVDLAINTVKSFGENVSPILMTGKYPSFLFSSKSSLLKILNDNDVSSAYTKTALKYYDYISDKINNEFHTDTLLFFYEEDFLEYISKDNIIDIELSNIVAKPVYIDSSTIQERFKHIIILMNESNNYNLRLITKNYEPVYSYIGENNSIWCKRGKWYFIFFEDSCYEGRFVTNSIACIARSDMFNDLLLNIPPNISTKKSSIQFIKKHIGL